LRSTRISVALAIFAAIAITTLMILASNSRGLWTLNWSVLWPAWYIVVTVRGNGQKSWTKLK
jgi:hypothetical protein